MSTYLYRVNAFSQELTSGNPAYVIQLTSPIQEKDMQRIAKELNLPITAFLLEQQCNIYELRWFTPSEEIKLCGHGTLAAAHILWEEGVIEVQHPITFTTKSGHLKVEKVKQGIQLAFSTDAPIPIDITPTLQQLVSVPILKAAQNSDRYIIEIADEESLKGLVPNLDLLSTLPVTGLVVTSPSTKYDFVTGSAHCGLAPYWSQRLNKKQLYAFQSSERGGELFIDYQDDLTYITGKAITIYKSRFNELLL
ncbi:PhzF family phenazine biosynthesis protein [Priestia aryabhattai]|uniref:PhzF family phenazine biosynthesis protein n=1 Tax=Priestia aryabhattai TaxID=412384 RepID=UPI002E1B8B75|nr:PhzF family phenazine biosynthesis protein [Priestia aryabhattai]